MRLDEYLVTQNLVKTRSEATDLIKQGKVLIDEQVVFKAGFNVKAQHTVKLTSNRQFVSRAGDKLMDAIKAFNLDVSGYQVVDVGSSTGGFVDCLLSLGANQISAYDVGTNQLHESLKANSKVISFEQTNILDVDIPVNDLITIDVSFTSVKPIILHLLPSLTKCLCLLKPQFETTAKNLKKGLVKDAKILAAITPDFETFLTKQGLKVINKMPTLLKGKLGNQEYMYYFVKD